MTENAADPNFPRKTAYGKLPLWYMILVLLGSAVVGGFFGTIYAITGIVFGAVGGMFVAAFWLNRVSRFKTRSIAAGIGWGTVAGLMDTVLLHATGLAMNFHRISGPESLIGLEIILVIAVTCGVVAGAVYGLVCMIVLEVQHSARRREHA